MSKVKSIQFCDATIYPGEQANLALPLPELYSCAPMYMPIKILHGKNPGPCVLIFATLRGSESNGFEIINRLLRQHLDVNQLAGTLIAVPVVNIYGFTRLTRTLPSGMDIDRCFPGQEDGNYGQRIAYTFTQQILLKADYCIELQSGEANHDILPQIYCNFDYPETKQLAKAFQTPCITNVKVKPNSIRETTEKLNIPLLVYEAGEALRFNEGAILQGINGVINVLQTLEMLAKPNTENNTTVNPVFSEDQEWILSPKGGVLYNAVSLGETVKSGQKLGHITDPFGGELVETIKASQNGIVVGINNNPLIYEGQSIFKIASFLDIERAENSIGQWEEQLQDN